MERGCSDDNELFELAEDLLPPGRHADVMRHVDTCERCRATLAVLVHERTVEAIQRVDETHPEPSRPMGHTPARDRASAHDHHREELPGTLLHAYLHKDAPARELEIARFVAWSAFALLGLVLTVGALKATASFVRGATWVLAAGVAYEIVAIRLLRRGWYRRWLPFASSVVEVSMICGVELVLKLTTRPALSIPAPGTTLLGSLIVFSALRSDARVPVVVGIVSALELLALDLFTPPGTVLPGELSPNLFRAAFCVIGGLAGRTLARHLTSRAEAALREIREQDLFGKYLLHETLGSGGMGEVLRATYCPEGGFVRTVAVKRLKPELSADPDFVTAFRAEVELGASLVHPNLVQMLDCGRFRGAFVVAMEYVDGATLSAVLRRSGALPVAAVTYLALELATALDYVHRKRREDGGPMGLVHCDVNPPNVLVSKIGEVKLADFGVARATARTTERQGSGGKLGFAAPEQLRGEPIDGRTDLFALGLTLYEALTGHRAIPRGSSALEFRIEPPSTKRSDVPAALDSIIVGLLAQSPDGRPRDASVLASQLLALEGDAAPYPRGRQLLAAAFRSS